MPRRIPASVTDAYNRAVKAQGDAAERAVRQALGEFFRENPAATAEEAREYAIELLRGAGDLYGAAASQAAYDLLQNVAYVDGVPMPDLGAWFYEADAEAIDRTAHYHAGKIVDGDVQGFIDQISSAARECAERGANETMSQAAQAQARRDGRAGKKGGRRRGARTYGVHFARVPSGSETCGFCLMLASRGFVYLSEESAGEFSQFHRHCDCRIVPGGADTKVDGYDPAELYDRWKHPEKYEEKGADAPTTRQQLEQEARRAYIANGGGMGLSAAEAAERFDLLVDGNTDAQLRGYIEKHGGRGGGRKSPATLGSGAGGRADSKPYDLGDEYAFDSSDPKAVADTLAWCKDAIRNEPVENVLIMTADGRLWHSIGTANAVNIDGAPLAGSRVIHNHTREEGGGSFGADDFIVMRDHPEMEELWAVDWQNDYLVKEIGDLNKITYNQAYRYGLNDYPDSDSKHSAMRYLHESGYIYYSRS